MTILDLPAGRPPISDLAAPGDYINAVIRYLTETSNRRNFEPGFVRRRGKLYDEFFGCFPAAHSKFMRGLPPNDPPAYIPQEPKQQAKDPTTKAK